MNAEVFLDCADEVMFVEHNVSRRIQSKGRWKKGKTVALMLRIGRRQMKRRLTVGNAVVMVYCISQREYSYDLRRYRAV